MNTKEISIFFGKWNGRIYRFGLSRKKVEDGLFNRFGYGDPESDSEEVFPQWATDDHDHGWRIHEERRVVPVIDVEKLVTDDPQDTWHIGWNCPSCQRAYSDDWTLSSSLPTLVGCGCCPLSDYILVENFKDS